jgi:hypothetical protein
MSFWQPTECVQDIIALFAIVLSGVCAEILGRGGLLARALSLCWSDESVAHDGEQPRSDIVVIAPCVQMVQGTDQTIVHKFVDLLSASQQCCGVAPKSRDA